MLREAAYLEPKVYSDIICYLLTTPHKQTLGRSDAKAKISPTSFLALTGRSSQSSHGRPRRNRSGSEAREQQQQDEQDQQDQNG